MSPAAIHRAIGEQIYGQTLLQITYERSIAHPAFPGPVVETNDVWLRLGRLYRLVNQTQDGVTTSIDTVLTSYVSTSLASHREAQTAKRFLQPFGALGVRTAEIGKSLHKNLLSTRASFTAKTAHMQNEKDGTANGRKIA